MIKAEVDGSGLLLLAVGCSAVKVGAALSVDGVAGLSDAGPSIAPASLLDFFFFVILWTKFNSFTNEVIFSQENLDSFRDRVSGKTNLAALDCNIHLLASPCGPREILLRTSLPNSLQRIGWQYGDNESKEL